MEDTGGQPEFMDMLPALTIGPALYLLFCKLIDDLLSHYTVTYRGPAGESSTPEESTFTVEEVLLSALASIACFRSSTEGYSEASASSEFSELIASSQKSVAYIIGTHKDLVSEEQITAFDEKLQCSIRSTDFFSKDLVQFSSEHRMVLPIDNMNGGEDEIKKVRKFLEDGMKQHFKKLRIPASWLVLSLCLRQKEERVVSLDSVFKLAKELGIPEKEAMTALWFLHHHAGVLMYFPDLPELRGTVICDTQVIYDSATNMIVNTFKFGKVSKAASEKYRKTGQFSLEDIKEATASVSGDYLPLLKLVKLLEHLNIIAPVPTQAISSEEESHAKFLKHPGSSPSSLEAATNQVYFMPCVLPSATHEELDKWWDEESKSVSPASHQPAPLFIRYECGYVPIGVFPALVANIVGTKCIKLISDNMKKNRVQFLLGRYFDRVTLVSRPKYYAIHISRRPTAKTPTHVLCAEVRDLVESTLKTVTSRMNYSFSAGYQLAFECPLHPGREHLCVTEKDDSSPEVMCCISKLGSPEPIDMKDTQMVWFGHVS